MLIFLRWVFFRARRDPSQIRHVYARKTAYRANPSKIRLAARDFAGAVPVSAHEPKNQPLTGSAAAPAATARGTGGYQSAGAVLGHPQLWSLTMPHSWPQSRSIQLRWCNGLRRLLAPRIARAPGAAPRGWADSEPIAKSSREVRSIGKTRLARGLSDREASLQKAARSLQPQQPAVSMRRNAEGALEAARQMTLRHVQLVCEILQRERLGEAGPDAPSRPPHSRMRHAASRAGRYPVVRSA